MKRKSKLLIWVFVFVLALCSFSMSAFAAVTKIEINETKNLIVGDSKPLVLTATPASSELPKVTWSSSNGAIATVDQNGIVTGLKAGSVTITATCTEDDSISDSVTLLVRSVYSYSVGWSGSFSSKNNNTTTSAEIPVEAARIETAWDAPVRVGNNPIVIVDDYIYTYDGVDKSGGKTNPGTLYKIHKETGEIEDSLICKMSSSNYYSYIIYGGGLLYVSGIDKVMAVDPDSFTVLWYADVPEVHYQTLQFVNDHIVTRGAVLDSTTGEKVKTLSGSYNYSNGVELNGLYYIASNEGKLYAFDTKTWTEKDVVVFRNSSDSLQAGVMHYDGKLYWSDRKDGNMCSIQIDESTGLFVDDSLIKKNCGIYSVCTPVAAGNRVYLAGQKNNAGVVGVFNSANLTLIYVAEGGSGNIQSTPILREVTADGPSIMSFDTNYPKALANGNYLVMQDFGDSNGSRLYVLNDNTSKTSGSLAPLARISPADYAYEQIACDKDGALYCTNDAGYLVKYQNAKVSVPKITKDLSTNEVLYDFEDAAEALVVVAESVDGGTLSYQWQSRVDGGDWVGLIGATSQSYTPSTDKSGTIYYRCIVTNTLNGLYAMTNSKVAKITVSDPELEEPEVPVVYGDVNNDGKVNAKDVTVLRRHLASWDGYELSALQKAAADVNGDSEVGADDATQLARYLAGWSGVTIGK